MLNNSFSPLTFLKLRFWPSKKKNYKTAPKFCNCSSFGPKAKKNKDSNMNEKLTIESYYTIQQSIHMRITKLKNLKPNLLTINLTNN